MKEIASTGYKVHFCGPAFTELNRFLKKSKYSSCFILCDENTLGYCLPLVVAACPGLATAEIIEIESGESSKSIEVTALICQTLLEKEAGRDTLLINLGGGVVTDLGGFCASIYKRGIDFINIPTSLLAMADASVGGKTGIDFCGVKNVLGSFHQPNAVFIYEGFLASLAHRHLKNGLAEICKMALISEKNFWKRLFTLSITEKIYESVRLKNNLVLRDPMDRGQRQKLNFGHTLGHAIESFLLSKLEDVLHGEAIAAGMIMEAHLSWQKKMLGTRELKEISSSLITELQRPQGIFTYDELLPFLANDKKNKGAGNRFALLQGIGSCKTGMTVTAAQIKKSITYYYSLNA